MEEIFKFELPKELIAQFPLKEREKARLMVVYKHKKEIKEDIFENIGNYLDEKDILVLNDTKVIPARFKLKKMTGGKLELLLIEQIDEKKWKAIVKGKIKEGIEAYKEDLICKIINKNENGSFICEFNKNWEELKNYGEIPLPPYIKREPEEEDKIYYQTVYAKKNGSIAAPTAGLHFTEDLLNRLKNKGIKILFITLHMGWSSIKILKNNELNVGKEYLEINEEVAEEINKGKKENKRIIAVGTGTVRALESAYKEGKLISCKGYTQLFIKPGYKFKVVDGLITNFHLPNSTHLYLVCAFGEKEIVKKAYEIAIEKKYRFYSYGDSMMII
ncbi:MAG: tRNA preQ1(34) S-adenosylmethionine ribosyltransferase-isomerase QueA [Candidatus Omnitrophica bacterium]|nr:tRNA preQ1(34) S-adenosylmethionine ribosyltransferase-isomerase QueA [Candidatus Omnitrophota bacterium]MCM8806472.1 tRNA preQ1(34) S-adenosylmethionine ribosyltransferase-isomerase QueA [Candidatus Omnitrophota bacterium]